MRQATFAAVNSSKLQPHHLHLRALLIIMSKKGFGTTARQLQPTDPYPTCPPGTHTHCTRATGFLPWGGGAPNPFGCARPFPSLPRFIGQNPLRSHHAQPACTNNTSASNHHIILDSTLCREVGRGGAEGKPGQQRLPFPTYMFSPQAMYAHPPDHATFRKTPGVQDIC